MTIQRNPIGFRLGVSHYWALPFYKLKYLSFSYSILKYLKLLVLYYFHRRRNIATKKPDSIVVREFFLLPKFHFWELSRLNIFIILIGKVAMRGGDIFKFDLYTYFKRTFKKIIRFGKKKKKTKKKIIRLRKKHKVFIQKPKDRFITFKIIAQIFSQIKKRWLWVWQQYDDSTGDPFDRLLFHNKSRLYLLKKLFFIKRFFKTVPGAFMLSTCCNPIRNSRYVCNHFLEIKLVNWFSKLFKNKIVKVVFNQGWCYTRYLYFCFILYESYFKILSWRRHLVKFYEFYTRAVLGMYFRELSLIFRQFRLTFEESKIKNIRFITKLFTGFLKQLAVIPLKRFGIRSLHIHFKGRAWAKKKKWSRVRKVKLLGYGIPLSKLNTTHVYLSKRYFTRFGVYGLKFWMVFDETKFHKKLWKFVSSDKKTPDQLQFISHDIKWVSF